MAYSRWKRQTQRSPNWNKPYTHSTTYDTSQTLSSALPNNGHTSRDDSTDPYYQRYKTSTKRRFDFEYLEFLKQKYAKPKNRNNKQSAKKDKNKLFQHSKASFCASPVSERSNAGRLAAQQQQMMAREDEINPASLGGAMVILLGAAIFYWLYHIDNTKHSGISSFLSWLSATKSIEHFVDKNETRPVKKIPDDWTLFRVVLDHVKSMFTSYNSEWMWSKLFRLFYIPGAKLMPPTKQSVYTLVVDLDTVCHSTWSRKDGFERSMRPYYAEFLDRMFKAGWEVVLFGQCEDYDWMESPDFVKLDGRGYVQNYLWNKDCYYFNGHRCKDLQRLGRDLKHVIAIDSDARSLQLQPENGIVLSKWKPKGSGGKEVAGEVKDDVALLQLIEFLEYLAKAEVADVRQVLAAYRGKDIAHEFRKRYFAAVHAQLQQQEELEEGEEGEEDDEEEEEEAYQH